MMLFTPYGARLESETVQAILRIEWDYPLTRVLQYMPQTGKPRQDVLAQYNRGRELFLQSDCDAMLVIESDIVPPPDVLVKLAALNADIAYGLYRYRNSVNLNVQNIYYEGAKNPGEPLNMRPRELQEALRQVQINCSGSGLGCVLISRHVLRDTPFRIAPNAHCDTWFTRDAWDKGYKSRADMSVVCGHIDTDGSMIWPEFHKDKAWH